MQLVMVGPRDSSLQGPWLAKSSSSWLPEAAHTGCHTVKDSSINKLSLRCQQPPFGLFRESGLCGGDLARLEEFKKIRQEADVFQSVLPQQTQG